MDDLNRLNKLKKPNKLNKLDKPNGGSCYPLLTL